jgi:hypothetical protein
MQLEGCWLALVRWNVWVRVGVESEAGIGRDLVRLWAGFRRPTRQRRAIRRRGINRYYIAIGEEVWAEFHVIVEVEGSPRFEALTKTGHHSRFFFFPYISELLVRMLG